MTMTRPDAPAIRPAPPRGRNRWLAAAAAAVALTGSAVVVVQSVTGADPSAEPAMTAAAQVLQRAADRVDTTEPGPGQYRYLETRQWSLDESADGGKPFAILSERRYEDWVPANAREQWLRRETASGKYKRVQGDEKYARAHGWTPPKRQVAQDKVACGDYLLVKGEKSCATADHWPVRKGTDNARLLDQSWLDSLPRDPAKLLRGLLDDIEKYGYPEHTTAEREAFRIAVATLGTNALPEDLTSALYRALALLPGIKVIENDATLNGRKGTALGMDFDGMRWVIILDEDTGEFLGQRDVVLDPKTSNGLPKGTVTYVAAYRTAVVDNIGQRPPK